MVDEVPHNGAPPEVPLVVPSMPEVKEPIADLEAEFEPEVEPEPLPLKVRPFDPARYHPQTHILPTSGGIKYFIEFARSAPEDLLLRKPDSHLSAITVEYDKLPAGVRDIIDEAGFGLFCSCLTQVTASYPLLGALVEKWWDTTNSFHFSTAGEMTMTPYDFAMITGLDVGGDPIPIDTDMEEWEATWFELLGAYPPIYWTEMVRYTWFAERFRGTKPETIEEIEQYARGFLMFVEYHWTVFAECPSDPSSHSFLRLGRSWPHHTIRIYELYLPSTGRLDWRLLVSLGVTALHLFQYMLSASHSCTYSNTLWVYAYFLALVSEPVEELPLIVPYSRIYDGQLCRRICEPFTFFRKYFDTVAAMRSRGSHRP
ncbi:hypothetical protein ACSBR1_025546 [Camellia fascicularis]